MFKGRCKCVIGYVFLEFRGKVWVYRKRNENGWYIVNSWIYENGLYYLWRVIEGLGLGFEKL